jgi:hypothetical protein
MTTEPTARIDAMSQVCAKSFDERRASPRQKRLNAAKIVFNNNASVIDCIVRDLPPQGARGVCHPSKVTWRANDQIGVSFLTFLG